MAIQDLFCLCKGALDECNNDVWMSGNYEWRAFECTCKSEGASDVLFNNLEIFLDLLIRQGSVLFEFADRNLGRRIQSPPSGTLRVYSRLPMLSLNCIKQTRIPLLKGSE